MPYRPSAAQDVSMVEHDTVENSRKPSETLNAWSSKTHLLSSLLTGVINTRLFPESDPLHARKRVDPMTILSFIITILAWARPNLNIYGSSIPHLKTASWSSTNTFSMEKESKKIKK